MMPRDIFGGSSNLPPGCSESDIPGSWDIDVAWEQFYEWLFEQTDKFQLHPTEIKKVLEKAFPKFVDEKAKERAKLMKPLLTPKCRKCYYRYLEEGDLEG